MSTKLRQNENCRSNSLFSLSGSYSSSRSDQTTRKRANSIASTRRTNDIYNAAVTVHSTNGLRRYVNLYRIGVEIMFYVKSNVRTTTTTTEMRFFGSTWPCSFMRRIERKFVNSVMNRVDPRTEGWKKFQTSKIKIGNSK